MIGPMRLNPFAVSIRGREKQSIHSWDNFNREPSRDRHPFEQAYLAARIPGNPSHRKSSNRVGSRRVAIDPTSTLRIDLAVGATCVAIKSRFQGSGGKELRSPVEFKLSALNRTWRDTTCRMRRRHRMSARCSCFLPAQRSGKAAARGLRCCTTDTTAYRRNRPKSEIRGRTYCRYNRRSAWHVPVRSIVRARIALRNS